MQIAQFLNSISSPQVQTGSSSYALSKIKTNLNGLLRKINLLSLHKKKTFHDRSQEKTQKAKDFKKSSSSLYDQSKKLVQTITPFYVNRREANSHSKTVHYSVNKQQMNVQINKHDYLKKGQRQALWALKAKQSKQNKKIHQIKRQRYTQFNTPTISVTHQFRKKYAQQQMKHRFCNFFGIACCHGEAKCKLDCVNKSFQQFLKNSDMCILKGLQNIAGRTCNLDTFIKAEIMNAFIGQQSVKSEQVFMKIQCIISKHAKKSQKKYTSWAKQMTKIINKIQQKNKNRVAKKSEDQNNFSEHKFGVNFSEPNHKSVFYIKNKNGLDKKQIIEYDKIFKNIDDEKIIRKKKTKFNTVNNKNYRQRKLSVIGKSIQSIHSICKKQIKLDGESYLDEYYIDPNGVIKTRLKSRAKNKRARISWSMSKSKIKNQLSHNTSILTYRQEQNDQHVPSIVFDNTDQQQYQPKKNIGNLINSLRNDQQSQFQEQPENAAQERLKLFDKLRKCYGKQLQQKQVSQNSQKEIDVLKGSQSAYHKLVRQKIRQSKNRKSRSSTIVFKSINAIKSILNMKTRKHLQVKQTEKYIRSKHKLRTKLKKLESKTSLFQEDNQKQIIKQSNFKNENRQIQTQIHKQLQDNSCLITKAESILNQNGLKQAIIKQSDSLLTQKRKIRVIIGKIQKMNSSQKEYINKYIAFFNKRARNTNQSATHHIQNIQDEKCIKQILRDNTNAQSIAQIAEKSNGLKFFKLRSTPIACQQFKLLSKIQAQQKQNIDGEQKAKLQIIAEKYLQNSEYDKRLLGPFQNYITTKQKIPYDFQYYIQHANTLASRKHFFERNTSNIDVFNKKIWQTNLSQVSSKR